MIIIIILILLIFLSYYFIELKKKPNITYYIISLKNKERLENIKKQLIKYDIKFELIDAIHWKIIDQDNLIKNNILKENFYNINEKRNKEIGCYQSHLKIYNKILNSESDYSIILEDDFNIITNNLTDEINKILNKMKNIDFDIIFLGNTFDNLGLQFNENIYKIDKLKETVGCYAYLINNKKIKKIIESTKIIDEPIDLKMNSLIKTDNLIAFTIEPNLINYIVEIPSTIND
jgi:glycosyl transferase, family 25